MKKPVFSPSEVGGSVGSHSRSSYSNISDDAAPNRRERQELNLTRFVNNIQSSVGQLEGLFREEINNAEPATEQHINERRQAIANIYDEAVQYNRSTLFRNNPQIPSTDLNSEATLRANHSVNSIVNHIYDSIQQENVSIEDLQNQSIRVVNNAHAMMNAVYDEIRTHSAEHSAELLRQNHGNIFDYHEEVSQLMHQINNYVDNNPNERQNPRVIEVYNNLNTLSRNLDILLSALESRVPGDFTESTYTDLGSESSLSSIESTRSGNHEIHINASDNESVSSLGSQDSAYRRI